MSKKKIYITGGRGFIGQALIKQFKDEFEIIAPSAKEVDITNYQQVVDSLKKFQPHFVIHLAARTEVEKSFYEPTIFSETNYVGTVNMAEACNRELKNLELFVFSSTNEVYGAVPKELWKPFDEESPTFENAPYAVAKKACEKYLEYLGRTTNFPYTMLRQTNSYGRNDNDFFVVEQIITQMLKGDVCNLGYREPYRNFLYIDDLVDLYYKLIKNVDLARGEIFCTGPDNVIQIADLAEKCAELLNWKGKINWGTKPARPGEIYYLNSTPEKAKRVLNWEPQVDLETGLKKTIDIWKKNYGIKD